MSYAFNNEPEDFRGIRWGTNLKEIDNMILIMKGANKTASDEYMREDEKLKIDEAGIINIIYKFYNNIFYSVIIYFDSIRNGNVLKDTLSHIYWYTLPPVTQHPDFTVYNWHGKVIDIEFLWDKYYGMGKIDYTYIPVEEKRKKDEKK
jgi:hypothetical protein